MFKRIISSRSRRHLSIPASVDHSVEVLEDSVVIEIFSPVR